MSSPAPSALRPQRPFEQPQGFRDCQPVFLGAVALDRTDLTMPDMPLIAYLTLICLQLSVRSGVAASPRPPDGGFGIESVEINDFAHAMIGDVDQNVLPLTIRQLYAYRPALSKFQRGVGRATKEFRQRAGGCETIRPSPIAGGRPAIFSRRMQDFGVQR